MLDPGGSVLSDPQQPVFASSFDDKGELIRLMDVRSHSHLMGIPAAGTQPRLVWELVRDDELPSAALDPTFLTITFKNIPFRTAIDVRREASAYKKTLSHGKWIVFFWAAVGPAALAVAEWSSEMLGLIVLAYSLWKAMKVGLQIHGKWKPPPAELSRQEEERQMRHHHHHCRQNPEGFVRLKRENFERQAKERTRAEVEALRKPNG